MINIPIATYINSGIDQNISIELPIAIEIQPTTEIVITQYQPKNTYHKQCAILCCICLCLFLIMIYILIGIKLLH